MIGPFDQNLATVEGWGGFGRARKNKKSQISTPNLNISRLNNFMHTFPNFSRNLITKKNITIPKKSSN